jgi:hypothetical protein
MNTKIRSLAGIVTIAMGALGALTLPSSAMTFETLGSGTFSAATCTPACTGSFNNGPETGAIDDTYAFNVSTNVLLTSDSATNASAVTGQQIAGFTIELWSGTPNSTHTGDTLLATGTGGSFSAFSQNTGDVTNNLAPGSYFLELLGTGGDVATTYTGSFAFAPTPLPGTLPLLASGLVGFLAWKRRRRIQPVGLA